MLHITNGDCTRDKLTEVEGEKIVWCDILHAGRAVKGIEESLHVRTAFHAELGFGTFKECFAKIYDMYTELNNAWVQHGEIVLWYEHDLFDQLNLIQLLEYFDSQYLKHQTITLVNIEKYARIPTFSGLGELSPGELKKLFDARQAVSRAQINLAQDAWRAFTSPHPREIEKFLQADSSALPFLRAALIRFLQEFPSVENGLSKTEQNALSAMQNGARFPSEIFQAAQKMEDAPFCGDTTFFALLMKLADGENPLFMAEQGEIQAYFSAGFHQQQWILTPLGKSVLCGDVDWIRLRGMDKHLGGAHLHSGATLWRWDEEKQVLTTEDYVSNSLWNKRRDVC